MQFHAPTGKLVIEAEALKQAAYLMKYALKSVRELAGLPLDQYERDGAMLTPACFAEINILECAEVMGFDMGVSRQKFNLLDLRNIKESMTLPKPQAAPEVDMKSVFAELHAKEAEWEQRATEVQARAAHAYERLLSIAETSDAGQASRVAKFIASTYNGCAYPFDLVNLRSLDVPISDDMLLCLDALRWARADLFKLVPRGESRAKAVVTLWQIKSVFA